MNLKLEEVATDSYASVVVKAKGNGMVVEVDPELVWHRDDLLKLLAALEGAAGMLRSSRRPEGGG